MATKVECSDAAAHAYARHVEHDESADSQRDHLGSNFFRRQSGPLCWACDGRAVAQVEAEN